MNEQELKAIISLLDDPDMEIFNHVEQQLITFGPEVIPQLEASWESSFDPLSQTRIENIIHKIQFDQIKNDLQLWDLKNSEDLLDGLLIVNRYQYPNLDESNVFLTLADLKRNAWFQLMYDMSPVEKVKLLNNILFREYGLSGNTTNYHDPQNSFIHKVLESKRGNPISLSCIYSIIAQQLDIPIYGVNLPKHFITAYVEDLSQPPLFYINPFNRGQIMHENDIYSFLKQLDLPLSEEYTMPCTNKAIIKRVLRNLIMAYDNMGNPQKKEEIDILLKIIEE
ncbi:transglutaminase superfamily protein [Sphingobacterium alimentarium]|uniref:Transglutaminase superfamily protein n=1 Tax=Sphingobacterium alimentarium TaxID=797292 RepID=A0A4R3W2L8_9SPHI|nr:transglutaminase-like domain-containing protein [Sphingobacterium alimentarium]TCV20360.1 transglutaminase superfamily protein [Sphingobacterium alimentarium]